MYEEVSQLLKEAKPLYLVRKRRNNQIKTVLAMLVCIIGIGSFYPRDIDYSFYANYAQDNWYVSETNTSVIENMGLPTDEYGLLMVG